MHPQLNIAISAARGAGRVIMRSIEQFSKVEIATKNDPNDYVTSVDKAAEYEIVKAIQKAYPKHSILGEESGKIVASDGDDNLWIVDPLDGTMNFVRGIPHFAISIAVLHNGILAHGVIYDPIRDELFTASKGSGAQLNGRRMRVSSCSKLQSAVLGTDASGCLMDVAAIRRSGSAALDLAYVAAGRLDACWEIGLKAWDIAAGVLLVREAGGIVSDLSGDAGGDAISTATLLEKGNILAANLKLHPFFFE